MNMKSVIIAIACFISNQSLAIHHIDKPYYDTEQHNVLQNNHSYKERLKSLLKYALIKTYNLEESNALANGCGIFGANAGFLAGKFLTHFVAHTAILGISLCTGPLAGATATSLEATLLPFIESASNVVGLAAGIAGGAATGPV